MMLERVCDTRRLDLYTTGKVSRLLSKVTGVKSVLLWVIRSQISVSSGFTTTVVQRMTSR